MSKMRWKQIEELRKLYEFCSNLKTDQGREHADKVLKLIDLLCRKDFLEKPKCDVCSMEAEEGEGE